MLYVKSHRNSSGRSSVIDHSELEKAVRMRLKLRLIPETVIRVFTRAKTGNTCLRKFVQAISTMANIRKWTCFNANLAIFGISGFGGHLAISGYRSLSQVADAENVTEHRYRDILHQTIVVGLRISMWNRMSTKDGCDWRWDVIGPSRRCRSDCELTHWVMYTSYTLVYNGLLGWGRVGCGVVSLSQVVGCCRHTVHIVRL